MSAFSKQARTALEELIPTAAVDDLEGALWPLLVDSESEHQPLRFRDRFELADIRRATVRLRSQLGKPPWGRAQMELMFALYRTGLDGMPAAKYVRESLEQAPADVRTRAATDDPTQMRLCFDATVRQSNDNEAHGFPPTEFLQRLEWNLGWLVRVVDGMLADRPPTRLPRETVRPLIAQRVAETLAQHGVRPTPIGDGLFQQVFAIVLREVGGLAPADSNDVKPTLPAAVKAD